MYVTEMTNIFELALQKAVNGCLHHVPFRKNARFFYWFITKLSHTSNIYQVLCHYN